MVSKKALIVVIGDQCDVLTALRLLLDSLGFVALTVTSVDVALERLRETGQKPDAVIADFHLDDNLIGTDATCHGNSWSVYFRDPEGNRIETFGQTPW